MSMGRRIAAIAAVAMAIGGALAVPWTAGAAEPGARFIFEQCDSAIPGGAVPAYTFENPNGGAMGAQQNCPEPGGSLGIAESGPAQGDPSYIEVAVPETPGGFVETETITAGAANWAEGNLQSHVYADGFPPGSGEWPDTFHVRSARELFNGNGGGFEIALDCNLGQACNPGAAVSAHYIAATEVDLEPPVLAPATGTALSGATLRGHQTLAASATDVGGGLTSLAVLINGLPAPSAPAVPGACAVAQVSNPSVYGLVTASPSPCPPALRGEWNLDTSAYPFHDGSNTVSVCASDLATIGNPNTTCSPPVTVTVDNSCTESPVPGGDAISAQFTTSDSESETVGYGAPAEVDGTLRDSAGDPVSGATICVKSQTLETGEAPAPVSAVKTDAEGRFAYAVPAGPDRELMLGYRHDSFQVARDVHYFAHVGASLEVDPPKLRNGKRVRLWGTLPGPSAADRVVILQANIKGSKRWITFRRATSDEQGGFESGYLFHSTTRRTIYHFRAIVPKQDHYPYVEGGSSAVSVLVKPARRKGRHPHHRHTHHSHK
jgi:hypothetical protein